MMEELLRRVAGGGLSSMDELAKGLGVPRPLVEAMIDDLARRGYLSQAGGGASCADCGGCDMAGCGPMSLWALTEKGARAGRMEGW